jgi:hypothetical protein
VGLKHSKAEIMSDQERTRQREHWQAIAEQLGLAPEGEQSAAESEDVAEPAKTERYARPSEEASEVDLLAAETSFSRSVSEAGPDDLEQETLHEEEGASEAPSPETHVHSESEEARDEQPTSRRRGRRERSEQSRRAVEGVQNKGKTASLTEEAAPEEPEEEPRRGRDRSRRRKGKPSRETDQSTGTESAPEAGGQQSEADDEIEELGDFSNWNVPSWNELIASLYRPER